MYLGAQLFTDSEYEQRLTRVRELMDRQGLSAIIVTDPANIFYLIGYNAWSFYTPQMLFVPIDGEMVFYAREMDAHGAHRTTWLSADQIVGYPESYVHRPHLHPFDWVAWSLRQRHLIAPASNTGSVGLEMDSHFFSPKAYRALFNAIPEWKLVDNFELVNWVRSVKSEAEVQLMRQAGMVCSKAMRAAIDTIDIGVRQCDAAAAISQAQITGTPEYGGDYPAIVPMMPTGAAADTPPSHLASGNFRRRRGGGHRIDRCAQPIPLPARPHGFAGHPEQGPRLRRQSNRRGVEQRAGGHQTGRGHPRTRLHVELDAREVRPRETLTSGLFDRDRLSARLG